MPKKQSEESLDWLEDSTLELLGGEKEPEEEETDSGVHIVQKGDSLWKIAEKVYGDGNAWKLIAKANPELKDPNKIVPGMELILPERQFAGPPKSAMNVGPDKSNMFVGPEEDTRKKTRRKIREARVGNDKYPIDLYPTDHIGEDY